MPIAASPNSLLSGDDIFARARQVLSMHWSPAAYVATHPETGRALRPAAVLVPLMAQEAGATILLTQRAQHLRDHAGQIAFPGGKIERDDALPLAAALREAQEEVGLLAQHIFPIGYLEPYLTHTGFCIVPVVAEVRAQAKLVLNREEVEGVFEVPADFLMKSANYEYKSQRFGQLNYGYYSITHQNYTIWGASAAILHQLCERLYA